MARRRFRKPHRYKIKKPLLRKRFLALGILILVVVGVIFYFLFFWKTFWVEKIIVSGQEKVAQDEIELLVANRLESRILFFKTKSIFIVNLGRIKKDILSSFPGIASVEVSRGFFDAIEVAVAERVPSALWCVDTQCFLTDSGGVAFEKAPPETELLRIGNEPSEGEPALGQTVIDQAILAQIFDIRAKLSELAELPIKKAALLPERRLNVETAEGWEIYFNLGGDTDWQVRELAEILEKQIPADCALARQKGRLEYVDLRFSRVYCK